MNRNEFIRVYKDFLKKTGMRPEEAVVGSGGTCLMLGLRKETADMDMSVSWEHFNAFLKSRKYKTHTFDAGGERGIVTVIEWSGVIDIHGDAMAAPTIIVDGVCCWSAEYTLEFKKSLNRPKDQEDIKNLERYIKQHKPSMESHPSCKW